MGEVIPVDDGFLMGFITSRYRRLRMQVREYGLG